MDRYRIRKEKLRKPAGWSDPIGKRSLRGGVLFGCFGVVLVLGGAIRSEITPLSVAEPAVEQMIREWTKCLVENDVSGLGIYYTNPQAVNPWKQKLSLSRFSQANLIAIHSIRSASDKTFGSVPLCGEVRFTVEFWPDSRSEPFNETRIWGLTNVNGYLQIAYEKREKEPAVPARRVEHSAFPRLGTDPSVNVRLVDPLPQPVPVIPGVPRGIRPTPRPVATPTLNEGPIAKDELIRQLWNTLLLKFKKAYELRNEDLYIRCFVKRPTQALRIFRENVRGRGWIQVDRLEINEDSVRGNNLNSTFTFRYSLWGPGMKKGDLVEVDCAAIRGGPGWRFARYGDEILSPPARAPGYYPTDSMIRPLLQPPRTLPLQGFLGGPGGQQSR